MNLSELLSFLAILVSGGSLLISVMSWRKNRTIYSFKRHPLRMPSGRNIDQGNNDVDNNINKDLKTGKWMIVDILYRKSDHDYDLILGQIDR